MTRFGFFFFLIWKRRETVGKIEKNARCGDFFRLFKRFQSPPSVESHKILDYF